MGEEENSTLSVQPRNRDAHDSTHAAEQARGRLEIDEKKGRQHHGGEETMEKTGGGSGS